MNCSVLALNAVFCSGLLIGALMIIYVHDSNTLHCTTTGKESACRIICMLCQQTSPKRWFANVNMTSCYDVTNSAYPLQQGFPTCGTRTTSGTRRSSRWYASNFHFFTKTWIHSFLVYVLGFVFK